MKVTTNTGYILAVILIAVISLTIIGSQLGNYELYAGTADSNQGHSATNSCGDEFLPTNILCSNSGSQVQGDENAVALTSSQEAPISILGDIIVDGFHIIKTAIVKPFNEPEPGLNAFLKTHGLIPENGEGGAFGYGLLTDQGTFAIIVTTTHAGVLDSETQGGDPNNPIWHNHFVSLVVGKTGLCGDELEIDTITFEQPGAVEIKGRTASLLDIPGSFSGTDALTGGPLTLSPGNNVEQAVSLKLDPKFDMSGDLQAVCVVEITNAENLIIK